LRKCCYNCCFMETCSFCEDNPSIIYDYFCGHYYPASKEAEYIIAEESVVRSRSDYRSAFFDYTEGWD